MSTLRKRGDVWYADTRVGGKRKQVSLHVSDKRTAEVLKRDLDSRLALESIGAGPLKKITVGGLVNCFLSDASSRLAVRTTDQYRYCFNLHLGHFYERPLAGISQSDLDQVYSGVTRETANHIMTYLMAMLNWGKARGYVVPAVKFKQHKTPEKAKRYRCLTKEEFSKVLAIAGDLRPLLVTAGQAGLRKEELFHLAWFDVDFVHGTITVSNKPGWHTKSYRIRMIPMSADISKCLGETERRSEWVFPGKDGSRRSGVRKALASLCRRAGVANFTLHDLRVTFLSNSAYNSQDIVGIQKLAGHSNIKTTMGYIRHNHDRLRKIIDDTWGEHDQK